MAGELPAGWITFVFTDVVGSTRAFAAHGQVYADALVRVQRETARLVADSGGVVVKTGGDGAFAAFADADAAVHCLCALQPALDDALCDLPVDVRAGAHRGEAVPVDQDYVSFAAHVASRVCAAAGPRQVLVTEAVVEALRTPVGELVGEFALRDVPDPLRLWRTAGPPSPPNAQPARRTNVADPHTSFIGRDEEVRRVGEALAKCRLVTIVGPGGVGKTRLATEFALRHYRDVAGGVWLVELASSSGDQAVLMSTASALSLETSALAGVVADIERRGQLVAVLDNCEHVLEQAGELAVELLARCSQLRILATSREPLDQPGERVIRVSPLAVSACDEAVGPAEQLFVARAAESGTVIRADTAPLVRQICRELDGLPLALELAAARTADVPLATLRSAVALETPLLERRSGPSRQRSLEALVGWSLQGLTRGELIALLALSAIPGAFEFDVATAILAHVNGADVNAVPGLRRRSLLDLDGDSFRMLSVVRRVVARRLEQSGQAEDVRDAIYRRAVDRIVRANRLLPPGDRDFYLLMEEICAWAVPRGLPGTGRILVRTVSWAWDYPGSSERLTDLCDAAVLSPPPAAPVDDILIRAAALSRRLGRYAGGATGPWTQQRVVRLIADAHEALAGDDLGIALGPPGIYAAHAGDLEAAGELFAEIVATPGVSPEVRLLARGDIAVILHLQGRLQEAEVHYRAVLEEPYPERPSAQYRVAANLAELLLDCGDPHGCIEVLQPRLNRGERVAAAAPYLSLYVEGLIKAGRPYPPELVEQAFGRLEHGTAVDSTIAIYTERLRRVLAESLASHLDS